MDQLDLVNKIKNKLNLLQKLILQLRPVNRIQVVRLQVFVDRFEVATTEKAREAERGEG